MSIKKPPAILLAIYALLAVLAIIFAGLLYLNPFNFESTPPSTQSATILAQAELLRNKGQPEEAEKLCQNALKLMEETGDAIQKARIYHALGLTYFQGKKVTEAQDSYRKALECLDRQIDQQGANRLTLENLRTAEQLHAEIDGALADLLASISKYEEAETLYRTALEKNDQYLGSMELHRSLSSRLANVLAKAGKGNESEELQIEAFASDYATKHLMAEIKRTSDEFEAGEIDSAKAIVEFKAIARTARRKGRAVAYVDAQTAVGKTTLEAGKPSQAKKELVVVFDYVKAGHHEPEDESIWLSRARIIQAACCLALHEDQEAKKFLNDAGQNPKLLFMCLQMHFRTVTMRTVEQKDYYRLLTNLTEMAGLEQYQKKKLSLDTLFELAALYDVEGVAWASFNQVDKANHYYTLGLEVAEQIKDVGRQAELETRLARVAVLQKKYADAERYYESSTRLHHSIKPKDAQAAKLINASISENYAELASMYNGLKDDSKARLNFQLAYDLDVKNNNYLGIFAFAQYFHLKGDYKAAHKGYELALRNLKSTTDAPKTYISLVESRLKQVPDFPSDPAVDALVKAGNKLLIENKTDDAHEVLQKAETAAIEKFGKESLESAQVYRNIADCYMRTKHFADAQPLYERALEIAGQNKVHFPQRNYVNLCICFSKDKNQSHKIDNAKKTIILLSPIVAEIESDGDTFDKPHLSSAELLIGEAYSAQSMYPQALDYFNKGVSAAEYWITIDPRDQFKCLLADALRARSLNQVRLKRFKAAIAGYKRAIEIWEHVQSDPDVAVDLADTRILLNNAIAEAEGT